MSKTNRLIPSINRTLPPPLPPSLKKNLPKKKDPSIVPVYGLGIWGGIPARVNWGNKNYLSIMRHVWADLFWNTVYLIWRFKNLAWNNNVKASPTSRHQSLWGLIPLSYAEFQNWIGSIVHSLDNHTKVYCLTLHLNIFTPNYLADNRFGITLKSWHKRRILTDNHTIGRGQCYSNATDLQKRSSWNILNILGYK